MTGDESAPDLRNPSAFAETSIRPGYRAFHFEIPAAADSESSRISKDLGGQIASLLVFVGFSPTRTASSPASRFPFRLMWLIFRTVLKENRLPIPPREVRRSKIPRLVWPSERDCIAAPLPLRPARSKTCLLCSSQTRVKHDYPRHVCLLDLSRLTRDILHRLVSSDNPPGTSFPENN